MDETRDERLIMPQETALPVEPDDAPPQEALRPLTLDGIVGHAFQIYARHWKVLVGVTAAVLLPFAALQSLVAAAGGAESGVAVALSLLESFFTIMLQGAIVKIVADHYLGRPVQFGKAWQTLQLKAVPLISTNLLAGLLIGVAVVIPALVAGLALAADSYLIGGLALCCAGLVAIVAGFWIAFTNQVVVIEGLQGMAALTRSRELTAGVWGRIFAIGLIAGLFSMICVIPLGGLALLSEEALAVASPLATGLAQVFIVPLSWAMTVLLYYDTRVRKEGFGLEALARSVVTFG